MKIIFDYNRTLFNPEINDLYPGSFELLRDMAKKNDLYLVSRNEPSRKAKLIELDIERFFIRIFFIEEKTLELFTHIAQGDLNVIVIGDRIQEEITLGNQLGYTTICIQHKADSIVAQPDMTEGATHTVRSIADLRNILSTYDS